MNLVSPDDPILVRIADPVEFPNRDLSKIVGGMMQVMMTNHGCGLAAPQIGLPLRMFVWRYDGRMGTIINPVIEYRNADKIERTEGCLTFVRRLWKTKRSKDIRVSYRTIDGESMNNVFIDGFLATIMEHEFDHLFGILVSEHGVEELRT